MTKNINNISITVLLLTLFTLSSNLFGQNNYQFIEPNISFSYDSTKMKITDRYSNTFYETEAYDFCTTFDTINKVRINVKANHPVVNTFPAIEQERIMNDRIKEFQKFKKKKVSLVDFDKTVRHIGEFLCAGFILLDKKTKTTMTTIVCNHISNVDITEVQLTSFKRKTLSPDYKIVEDFLKGFSSYPKEKIFTEDSLINAKYTISILKANDTMENLSWRKRSYFAVVKTNEQLMHKVKEVRLNNSYGKEIFKANDNGEVYIYCWDKEKGIIERKGELIIINSFGKNVKIPFTFKYENK